jgi:hypothetical protein
VSNVVPRAVVVFEPPNPDDINPNLENNCVRDRTSKGDMKGSLLGPSMVLKEMVGRKAH